MFPLPPLRTSIPLARPTSNPKGIEPITYAIGIRIKRTVGAVIEQRFYPIAPLVTRAFQPVRDLHGIKLRVAVTITSATTYRADSDRWKVVRRHRARVLRNRLTRCMRTASPFARTTASRVLVSTRGEAFVCAECTPARAGHAAFRLHRGGTRSRSRGGACFGRRGSRAGRGCCERAHRPARRESAPHWVG